MTPEALVLLMRRNEAVDKLRNSQRKRIASPASQSNEIASHGCQSKETVAHTCPSKRIPYYTEFSLEGVF